MKTMAMWTTQTRLSTSRIVLCSPHQGTESLEGGHVHLAEREAEDEEKAEEPDQLHVHYSGSGKKKGVCAHLKATVLAKQPSACGRSFFESRQPSATTMTSWPASRAPASALA